MVTGQPYRFRALGGIRVRAGEITSYQDHVDAIATARLIGRPSELSAALVGE